MGGNIENPLLSLQQTNNNKSRINQTTRQQLTKLVRAIKSRNVIRSSPQTHHSSSFYKESIKGQ